MHPQEFPSNSEGDKNEQTQTEGSIYGLPVWVTVPESHALGVFLSHTHTIKDTCVSGGTPASQFPVFPVYTPVLWPELLAFLWYHQR